jgi:hypothetical protein
MRAHGVRGHDMRGHGVRGHEMRGHCVRGHDLRGHGALPSVFLLVCLVKPVLNAIKKFFYDFVTRPT